MVFQFVPIVVMDFIVMLIGTFSNLIERKKDFIAINILDPFLATSVSLDTIVHILPILK